MPLTAGELLPLIRYDPLMYEIGFRLQNHGFERPYGFASA
jgi:hypothetical protein